MADIYGFTMRTIDGKEQPLAEYRGTVLLVEAPHGIREAGFRGAGLPMQSVRRLGARQRR